MNRARLTGLAASVLAAAAMLVATSAPAQAATTCPAHAVLPARVSVDRPVVTFSVPIATTCENYSIIAGLLGPLAVNGFVYWPNSAATGTFSFNASSGAAGLQTTFLNYGTSSLGPDTVAWTETKTVIRFATYDYIASSRVGRAVYVNGLVKNYSKYGLAPAAGRPVYLQRYLNGAWQTMLSRTANSTGRVTVSFLQNTVFQYRWVSTDNDTQWGNHSISTFR